MIKLIATMLAAFLLTGCIDPVLKESEDVHQYISSIKNRQAGQIEDIPSLSRYVAKRYQPKSRIDPFFPLADERKKLAEMEQKNRYKGVVTYQTFPFQNHRKSFLETFELDELVMIGMMQRDNEIYALIRDPKSNIHRISVGMFAGKNFGQIKSITDNGIEITEVIPDGDGNWIERSAKIRTIKNKQSN